MRRVRGAGRGARAAPVAVAVAGDPRDGRALEVVGGRARPYSELAVPVNEHVHGQHTHHLGHDEGEGAKVEGPAVGVAVLLGIALGWVARVG